ncbi:NmrA-domain-containing protein [Acephala macrosclerotiorum]|nr:NmrA-domain-containing protein [Acephala macrosclerotiorum]
MEICNAPFVFLLKGEDARASADVSFSSISPMPNLSKPCLTNEQASHGPSALKLQQRRVEIVQTDLSDPASLVPAVEGSYAVFGVTNYWDKGSAVVEVAQGKAITDASVNAGARLLIWSSLPNATKMTNGTLTTVVYAKPYFLDTTQNEGGRNNRLLPDLVSHSPQYVQSYPLIKEIFKAELLAIPMIDVTDTGKYLTPILLNLKKYNGKSFTCATVFYNPIHLVEGWAKVTGKKVTYEQIDIEKQGTLTDDMHQQLKKSLGLINVWGYFGPSGKEDLEWTLA